jgi:hypothetical protein
MNKPALLSSQTQMDASAQDDGCSAIDLPACVILFLCEIAQ